MVDELRDLSLKTGRQSRIALEAPDAPGVMPALSAYLELPDFSFMLKSVFDKTRIKRKGATYGSGYQTGVEDTEVTGNGAFNFITVNYLFRSISGTDAPTEVVAGSGAWKRKFVPGGRKPLTFAVHYGDPLAALEEALNCFLHSVAIDSGMKETNLTASGRGKDVTYLESDGETPVGADPDDIQRVPQLPANAVRQALYLSDDLAGLGAAGASEPDPAKRFFGIQAGIGNYYETIVEKRPDTRTWDDVLESDNSTGDVKLVLGNIVTYRVYLLKIRNDQKFFIRYEIIGPEIFSRAQVETATAVGTVTGDGNASAVVTGAHLAGSPITVPVAVLNGDTPAVWAPKVRAALVANSVINAGYIVGGSGANITLTDRTRRANDGTLNVALATGTATGITAAPTSTNTTAGVAPIYNRFSLTACVMFKEGFNPGEQAPLRTLEFPLEFAEDDEGAINGWAVETVCGVADLSDPLDLIP